MVGKEIFCVDSGMVVRKAMGVANWDFDKIWRCHGCKSYHCKDCSYVLDDRGTISVEGCGEQH